MLIWLAAVVAAEVILRHYLSSSNAAVTAWWVGTAVVAIPLLSPLRLGQLLTPAVSVKGWGRLEPWRQRVRYAVGAVLLALIATMLWSVLSGK